MTRFYRPNLKRARLDKGMTQQMMADALGITLRHYQKIEYAEINGSFEVWDGAEDILGIHQRILRVVEENHPVRAESR